MSTLLYTLTIVLSNIIIVYTNDIHCIGSFACQDIQSCNEGEDCNIKCNGTNSCQFATLLCPKNYKCTVTCDNMFACSSAIINASRSSELIINGCTYSDACTFLDIYCPPHVAHAKKCKISGNDNIRKGVDYYAIYGFSDIEFDFVGNYAQDSSHIFCSSDYMHSCAIANNSFSCDPNGDISCNEGVTIVSTSLQKTTQHPTSETSRNPTNKIPFLPELGTIHLLGINVHILWLVIVGLIALILCIGCCLIYFICKSHRDDKLIKKRSAAALQKVKTLSHDPTHEDTIPQIVDPDNNHSNITMTPMTPSTATQSTSKQTISHKSTTNNRSQPRKYSSKRFVASQQRHTDIPFGSPRNINEIQMNHNQNRQRPYSFASGYQNSNSININYNQNWNESQKSMHSNSSHQQTHAQSAHKEHSNSSQRKQVSRHSSFKNVAMYPISPAAAAGTQTRAKRAQTYAASPPSLHSNASHSNNSSQLIQKQMIANAAANQQQQMQPNMNYVGSNHYANAVNYANTHAVHLQPSNRLKEHKGKHKPQTSILTDATDSDSTDSESDSSDSSSENHTDKQNSHQMRIVVENVNKKQKAFEIPLENAMKYMKQQKNLGVIGSNMAVNGSVMTLDQEPATPTEDDLSRGDTERTTFYEDEHGDM